MTTRKTEMTQAVCEAAQLFKEARAEWRKAEHEAAMRRAETYERKMEFDRLADVIMKEFPDEALEMINESFEKDELERS
jgi:hypothetical protein